MGAKAGLSRRQVTLGIVVLALASTGMAVPATTGRATAAAAATVGTGAERANISRDSYGVPTVTAARTAGVWFGAGYAQAQDRLVQLELTRRAVEGTLSQLFGSGELSQDEGIRTFFYTPAELHQQVEGLAPAMRQALSAFSDGINAYLARAFSSKR